MQMIDAAERYIKSGQGVISSADDLYNFFHSFLEIRIDCSKNIHKGRTFFLLPENKVRPEMPPLNTIVKLHAIKKSGEDSICIKQLSCFCYLLDEVSLKEDADESSRILESAE